MWMNYHRGYFFGQMRNRQFSKSEISDSIEKWDPIFFQSRLNTAIDNIKLFLIDFNILWCNFNTFLQTQNFLAINKADKELKHIWPYLDWHIEDQFSNFCLIKIGVILFYCIDNILNVFALLLWRYFPNVHLHPFDYFVDLLQSLKYCYPNFWTTDVVDYALNENLRIGNVFLIFERINKKIEQIDNGV